MARINLSTIKKLEKEKAKVHDPVTTTYSTFDVEGEHYVQIDTYGRSNRALPERLSQSLQLDSESAKFLVKILSDEFDL